MTGEHGYRRKDALEALGRGLRGKLPASWRYADEDAAVEIWLTIHGATAVCGLRLSDRSMRHRMYKAEHLPASLRPSLAAAMVQLAETRPGHSVLDPMCGAGTILAEQMNARLPSGQARPIVLGGDVDCSALRVAGINLRRIGEPKLVRWDASRLPLPPESIDRIVSNPPFGKQLSRPEEIGPLYQAMVRSYDRVLKPDGRAVLLVSDVAALKAATRQVGWTGLRQLRVRVLGQPAAISVWRKGVGSTTITGVPVR
jgi:23S rRNA G2445 N2-methylase RlmL